MRVEPRFRVYDFLIWKVLGEDMARQLTEIEKAKETEATGNTAEMQQLCEEVSLF